MRPIIVAGNWKMHTTPADAGELRRPDRLADRAPRRCPRPVSALRVPRRGARRGRRDGRSRSAPRTSITRSPAPTPASVSAPMLVGLATWVIVGHSERRRDAGETDELIDRKLLRALEPGLRPILCVGEQLADRDAGRETKVVEAPAARLSRRPSTPRARRRRARRRVRAGLGDRHRPQREPGRRRAMAGSIRAAIAERAGAPDVAAELPVLYGGSVTSANFGEFIDGARHRRRARRRRVAQARRDGGDRRARRRGRPTRDGLPPA